MSSAADENADAGHAHEGRGPGGGPPGGGPPGRGGPGGPPGGQGFNPIDIFETQDANKDDKLTGDEIPDRMRERLDHVDTDGNGEVSREEIEALAERFQRGGPPGGGRGGPPGGGRGGPPGGGRGGDSQSDRPSRPDIE